MNYEYVIWDNIDNVIHRGPLSEASALEWIQYCREAFPEGSDIDAIWSVRRRAVGEWETYDEDNQ